MGDCKYAKVLQNSKLTLEERKRILEEHVNERLKDLAEYQAKKQLEEEAKKPYSKLNRRPNGQGKKPTGQT